MKTVCDYTFHEFKKTVILIEDTLRVISQEFMKIQNQTNATVQDTMNKKYSIILEDTRELLHNLTFIAACWTIYGKALQDVKQWLFSDAIISGQIDDQYTHLSKEYNYEKESRFLKETTNKFGSIQNEVASYGMTMAALEDELPYSYLLDIQNQLTLLRISIEQNLALPLEERLDSIRPKMIASYSEALIRLRNISRFFPDKTINFESKAKKMKIWLSPKPDPQVCIKNLEESNG